VRRAGFRGGLHGPTGGIERSVLVALGHGDDRLQRERVGVVRGQAQRALDVGGGLVHTTDGEEELRPVGEEACVGDGRRDGRDGVEGALDIPLHVGIEGSAHQALPIRPRGKFVRAEVQDRGIVQCPLNCVAGPGDDTQDGRLAALGHGRLAARERETPARVLRHDGAFEHRQQRLARLQPDEEFRPADAGDGEWRLHLEAARASAEEMCGAPQEVHHAGALVLHRLDRELGVGVQPQHRLIEQREIRPTAGQDANGIAGGKRVVQPDRLPRRLARATRLDDTLHRDRPCYGAGRSLRNTDRG
jgi:hypothetical protein